MRTVKANVLVGSGGESGTGSHLKAWIILAGSRFTCSKPKVKAGQILRPTPKGAIFTPFIPFKSTLYTLPRRDVQSNTFPVWNVWILPNFWILCHPGSVVVVFHIYTCCNGVLSQLHVTRRNALEGGTGRSP
uniref:Uncharacterized protein n=1 Tax=Kalanchoe fedtschenkoi TaxID=63787 RepID=A0A7N0TNB8_KALFE